MLFAQAEAYDLQFPYKGTLTEIAVDSQGYLWVHDDNEFHRFNGHQFEAIGLGSVIGLRKDDYRMHCRIIFNQDSLYFNYKKYIGLVHPRTLDFTEVWELPEKYYLSYLYQDEVGHLWVFAASWNNLERPVFKSEDGKNFKQVLDLNDVIGTRSIRWDFSELNDKDGTLYFQWRLGDLLIINPAGQPIELDVKDKIDYESKKYCSQFRLDNNKNLWRIFEKEFEIFNVETKSFESHPVGDKIEFVTKCKIDFAAKNKEADGYDVGSLLNLKSIFVDSQGRIWMGCAASYLVCYDPSIDELFNFRSQIVEALEAGNHDIKKIIEDKDGNIWGMNKGGLFKIRKQTNYFEKHLINTSDPNHAIYAQKDENPTLKKVFERYNDYVYKNSAIHFIEEDSEGNLILQTNILSFQLNSNNEVKILPLLGPLESVFLSYNDQLKLFGVWNSYYKVEEDFQLKQLKEPILKIENYYVQRNGDIWLSGLLNPSNYLFGRIDRESYEFEGNYIEQDRDSSFLMKKVTDMSEDDKENLLLGTTVGLYYLDTKKDNLDRIDTKYLYRNEAIEIGKCIDQVECLDGENFWFLTQYEVGLANFVDKTIKHLVKLNDDSNTPNISFLNYGDSTIWIANNEGIEYHNFNQDYSLNISSDKGLNTNGSILSLKKLSNDKIAVGTNNGLYVFHPDSLLNVLKISETKEKEYNLLFDSYKVIDAKTDSLIEYRFLENSREEIVLNYNDKMLSINFSLINFNYPKENYYSYKLDGYDPNWSTPSNQNSAIFTSLPPGKYNLKVKAKGISGIWSENMLSIPVYVKEAWFRTYKFIALCAILLASFIYLLSRYYFNQKLERRKEIEKLRQSISHDLHDDVGSILAGLSMKTELMAEVNNQKMKKELLAISESSRVAMSRMRDVVWAMDFSRDKYENLIIRMKNFAQEQIGNSQINFSFDVDEIDGAKFIKPNVRQNLYLIYKEAMTNALKHSNGDKILISLKEVDGKQLQLRIKDNGNDFDQSKSEGVGFASMKNRATKIGAKMEILSDEGYEVRISLPT